MPHKLLVVPVFAGLALLAGCGAAQEAPTLIDAAAAQPDTDQVSVNAADVAGLGPVLTDRSGKTLYVFTKDSTDPPASKCVDQCAENWPPLLADGKVLASGLDSALVGTVARPDGSMQVTVARQPVYMYAGDTGPGQANGQGIQDAWFAVTPLGTRTGAAGAPPAPAPPANQVGPATVFAKDIPGFGPALVNQDGLTLYLFTKDSKNPSKSRCDGDCAKKWHPLLTAPGKDINVQGVDWDLVQTVPRDDGSLQVTVGGWPVYLFTGDKKPGDTNGHGADGVWFAIEARGCKSTAPVKTKSEEADGNTGY
ncbi:SCO0930 family lipoprotein [Actinophytocola sp.]|uniref:SCO0930 family lipoprotein n=1 Tax=Actinophytocola sp. TaxID=1872138 RepID=UPI00389B2A9A